MAKKHLEQYDKNGTRQEIYLTDDEVMVGDKTLADKLDEMQDDIEDAGQGDGTVTGVKIGSTTYEPTDGVVDLSSPMGNKVDKETGKGLSTNDYTTAEKTKLGSLPTNPVQTISVNGGTPVTPTNGNVDIVMEEGEVPTKVSELENDEGYITAETISDIVVGTGDIVIEDGPQYVEIFIYSPEMSVKLGGNEVSSLAFFSDPTQQESLSLAVSGSHLKANIVATLEGTDANKFSISGSPITQSGGAASGTLTVAYTGTTAAGQSASATLKLTCGDLVKTISLHYAYASGPFISVNPASLSFKAATGSTETKTLAISASQLTGDVVVSTPSGSAFQVCATENGTYGNSVTVAKADAEAGKTIYVKYTAGSSAASASVTVSSTDATSRTVELIGAVSTISVSKQSMTFSTDQGVAVTDTFTVEGANLREAITIAASGAGFSVSPQTIGNIDSSGTVASTTVTVTYSPSAAGTHTGSITIQSSGVTKTVSLSGTATAATTSDENGRFSKEIGGNTIYFGRIEENGDFTNNVAVYNPGYNTSSASSTKYSGDIEIPATVACDGTTYNVTTIESYAFTDCSRLTSLTLHEGLTTIKNNAIRGCKNSNFTTFVIPNSVTSISNNCLYECDNISNLTIGTGITSVGEYFYSKCGKGRNVVIPANVNSFPVYAFYGTTFNNVTIEGNISSWAGPSRFEMLDGSSVTIKATTPPTLNGYPFANPYSGTYSSPATLYVPSSAVNDYKTAPRWGVMNNSEGCMFPNEGQILAIPED